MLSIRASVGCTGSRDFRVAGIRRPGDGGARYASMMAAGNDTISELLSCLKSKVTAAAPNVA